MSAAKQHELFDAALEIPDRAQRSAMLDSACAGDAGLRARVEDLLAAHSRSEKFFSKFVTVVAQSATAALLSEGSPAGRSGSGPAEDLVGSQIGPYTLWQKLGEGGGGVVYLAEQKLPVRRRVALKIIKPGMDTQAVIARFAVEQQALAMMDHPNIARVLDAGVTQTGRPFFAMELVQGQRITDYCDEHGLDTRRRLELFIQVCHAIQHAHQKGIIHRDIKPTNVLVTEHDGRPVPKVIDFGIAKAMEDKLTLQSGFTAHGLFIGTPTYMSPEQSKMSGMDVDTRSDIYSLGVLLYELLIGKTPFEHAELMASGLDGMRRTIQEQEPRRPSARLQALSKADLAAVAQRRQVDPPRLRAELKGDLDWLVMRALEKDRSRRYQTANGLALDVRRFLDSEPITARPPSRLYNLQKLVRRNKIVFAAAGMVIATLVAGIMVSTKLWLKEREARRQLLAEQQQKIALQQEAARLDTLRLSAEQGRKIAEAMALFRQGKLDQADQLLEVTPGYQAGPEDAPMFRQTGDGDAEQGRWAKALSRFTTLRQINQPTNALNILDDFRIAVILVDQGEIAQYQALRRETIALYKNNPDPLVAGRVLRLCLLSQADDHVLAALQPFMDQTALLIQNSARKMDGQSMAWSAYSLALMEYRSGNYAAATNWCATAFAANQSLPYRDVCIQLIRAMACAQLGEKEKALANVADVRQKCAAEAKEMTLHPKQWRGFWFDWTIIRILQREADALLGDEFKVPK